MVRLGNAVEGEREREALRGVTMTFSRPCDLNHVQEGSKTSGSEGRNDR